MSIGVGIQGPRRRPASVEITRRHFLCCALGAAAGTLGFHVTAEAGVKAGDRPKTVILGDLTGAKIALPDAYEGKVVVVHFWASWCPSCLRELEALESLLAEYRERGLVAVSVNVGETQAAARDALRSRQVTHPVLLDSDAATARLYGVRGVPTTFVVDRAGAIEVRVLGEMDRKALRQLLARML